MRASVVPLYREGRQRLLQRFLWRRW